MLQINKYKKQCKLNLSEIEKITDFFSEMFEVDRILDIHLYSDEDSNPVCEIEGFDDPISTPLGEVGPGLYLTREDVQKSYDNFMNFYKRYVKEHGGVLVAVE